MDELHVQHVVKAMEHIYVKWQDLAQSNIKSCWQFPLWFQSLF
jgi:hypothetical protein